MIAALLYIVSGLAICAAAGIVEYFINLFLW